MKKAIGYICAPCEFITVELIQRIEEAHKKFKVVGVGVHSDNFFLQQNGRKPIKKYEDRSNLVKALKGVDFVFELDSENDIDISDLPIDTTTSIDFPKQYRVAYAPGTYDLFHEGHLEHLKEVRTLCEILIVGVNSDEVVWKNKAKKTKISEKHRLNIISNLDFVDYSFIIEKNLKSYEVQRCTELCGLPVDVIFFGSDIRNVDIHNDTNVPILFTERDPVLMKMRSSTYYRKVLEELK